MPPSAATQPQATGGTAPDSRQQKVIAAVRRFFEARDHLRRGICFLNAGRYAEAAREFMCASGANPESMPLPAYLAAALTGQGRHAEAATELRNVVEQSPGDVPARIRHALSRWAAGDRHQAVLSLREGLAANPDSAELHFQLATLLAALGEQEEAELRFTQAVVLAPDHADGLVGLALCEGARGAVQQAVKHLERAQCLRPADTRINMLFSLAVQAAGERGRPVSVMARMPGPHEPDEEAVEELSRVIEAEPDFVDAFLSLPAGDVDEEVFTLLAAMLKRALRRQPEYADLYYHCGRVLERLGRRNEAIEATEKAVTLDPKFTRALIHLAKLYQQTDRLADATTRLEQTLRLGADYADTYYLLGNLYRESGQLDRARWAYGNALRINEGYTAAREALEALAA